jgi:hypothetical protein
MSEVGRLWPIGVIGLLAVVALLSPAAAGGPVLLATPDRSRADQMRSVIGALPEPSNVLIGMDPDLGTYPEIRPAVRAVLADVLGRGGSLSLVSFTPEGRAVAAAEQARIQRLTDGAGSTLDLGFVTGAEAGMVRSVSNVLPATASGSVADALRAAGGGMSAFDLVVVVGGGDIGPRTWVEQVGTRLPDLPMVAVAPTFEEPELQPYLRTGQLRALLATVRDDAAYVALGALESTTASAVSSGDAPPSAVAMLIGLLIALVVLLESAARSLLVSIRAGLAARAR